MHSAVDSTRGVEDDLIVRENDNDLCYVMLQQEPLRSSPGPVSWAR